MATPHSARQISAIALVAGFLSLLGALRCSHAQDRYNVEVHGSGTVSEATSAWHFDNDGTWKWQRAGSPLLPFRVEFHNNNPAGLSPYRARIALSPIEGVPAHWDPRPTSLGSARYTAFIPSGTSAIDEQLDTFRPTLRFLKQLPTGHSGDNSPLFHDFRSGGDGAVIALRERIKFRIGIQCEPQFFGPPVTYDSVELVLYCTGEVTLADSNDTTAKFSFDGNIPTVHVYARPELLTTTRPGAIDGFEDDVTRYCACDESCIAGALAAYNNSVDLNIGMGVEGFGFSRSLWLKSDVPATALAKPSGLDIAPGLTKTYDATGDQLLQIEGAEAVVAVETLGDQEYQLEFHHKALAGAPDPATGLFAPPGTPHTTIHLENPNGINSPDQLTVTRTTAAGAEVFDYQYTAASDRWELATSAAARTESTQITASTINGNDYETETRTLTDAAGGILSKTETVFWLSPFGRVKTATTIDPDGRALTNAFAYYEDKTNDGDQYGLLKYTIDPNGMWTHFSYDPYQRVTKRVRPIGDPIIPAPAYDGSQDAQLHVVTTTRDDFAPAGSPTETVVETYLGTEVARRYTRHHPDGQDEITCQTPGAAHDAADNLITEFRKHTSGPFERDPLSIKHRDGTLTLYSYSLDPGGTLKTTTIDSGEPDATGDAIVDGVRSVTTTNQAGTVTAFASSDIATGTVTASFTATTDEFGRTLTTTYLDGTTTTEQRDCCSVTSATDRLGTTTYRSSDDLSVTEVRNGVARVSQESPTARPGGGRSVTVSRSTADANQQPTGTATVLSHEEYDTAGLLVASYGPPRNQLNDPDPADPKDGTQLQFDTTIDPATGRTTRTSTAADGGTTLQEFFTDGRLAKISGSGVYDLRYEYGVEIPPSGTSPHAQFFTKEIVLDANGNDTPQWQITYLDLLGREVSTLSSAGAVTTREFNALGQLTASSDADGVTTRFAYDARGRLLDTAIDMDRDGTIGYDGSDRITRVLRGFGNRDGKPTETTTTRTWATDNDAADTAVTTVEASTDGLDVWTTTDGLTTHVSRSYAGNGISTVTTLYPDNSERTQIFHDSMVTSDTLLDDAGAQVRSTNYSYDALNRIETISDAHDGDSTYTYYLDDLTRTVTTPDPDGVAGPLVAQSTTYTYTPTGRRHTVTHPDGAIDTYTYHLTGEISTSSGTRRTGSTTTYDHAGRMKSFTGGGAGAKTWNYHPQSGFLTSIDDANGKGASFTHTDAGRTLTRTSARLPAVVTSYAHDHAGVVNSITHSDATPGSSFTFDRVGNLKTATRGPTTHTYTTTTTGRVLLETVAGGPLDGLQRDPSYDALLRRSTHAVTLGADTFTQSFNYDGASRPRQFAAGTTIATSPSATVSYHPDTDHPHATTFADATGTTRATTTRLIDHLRRTTSIATSNATGTLGFAYGHNASGQRDRVDLADGSYWLYSYAPDGQLASANKFLAGGTQLASQSFAFTSDQARNRLSAKLGTTPTADQTFTPNPLNQLTAITHDGQAWVTGLADPAATVTVDGNPANRPGAGEPFESLTSTDNSGSSAVAASFLVESTLGAATDTTTRSAVIDPATQTPSYDEDGNLLGDARWSYTWDAEDQLIAIETAASVPLAVPHFRLEFDYDYLGRRIAKRSYRKLSGQFELATDTRFIHDGHQIIAEIVNGELARSFLWGPTTEGGGGLLAVTDHLSGKTYFAACDARGDVVALTDATTGATAARYAYSPFGQTIEIAGPAAHLNPFRFSTQYHDPESGFYHYGARYYNPENGRWLKRDPAGTSGGANEYAFVGNDPINQVDVGGLVSWRSFDLIGAANHELDRELELADRARLDLDLSIRAVNDEIETRAKVNCEFLREQIESLADKAVALGIHTTRAANLANDYYAEANPIGAREAYAKRVFDLKQAFADQSYIDPARLGPMRNNLEMLGTTLTDQLNFNDSTLAVSKVTATASLALLDVAGAPGLSTLLIAGTKATAKTGGRLAVKALPHTSNLVTNASTKAATFAKAAAGKTAKAAVKKFGSNGGGFNKVVAGAQNRQAGSAGRVAQQSKLVLEPANAIASTSSAGASGGKLILGRGTPEELRAFAEKLGGRVIDNSAVKNDPKALFKHIDEQMRNADEIIQITDDIPIEKQLMDVRGRGKGQWSRAEFKHIDNNASKFKDKTRRRSRKDIR